MIWFPYRMIFEQRLLGKRSGTARTFAAWVADHTYRLS
jgi:hypothetical protein